MTAERVVHAPAGDVASSRRGDGVTAFLGIPFASPPVGERRFRAPVAHPVWPEPLVAERFGASPMQQRSVFTEGLDLSEDCLTLNIWAPDAAVDLPVVFWVYGGGFAGGSSAVPLFDGSRLAAEAGIVVVSANHRTGALGFASLVHRGLPEASNLGLRDVVAALRWTAENIGAFGGDPAQVTVMGQSSGAFLSAALLAVPEARSDFDKLLLISGGASRLVPEEQAERLGDQLLATVGVESGPELLSVGAETIVEAQRRVGSLEIGARNAPVPESLGVVLDHDIDGVLSAHPLDVIRSGQAERVPILLMVTGAEVAGLRGPDSEFTPPDDQAIVAEIAGWGAADAAGLAAAYGDGELGAKREQILTDFIYRLPAARAALAQNAAGGRAWVAQIDEPDGSLAGHDLPVRVLFGNLDGTEGREGPDPLEGLSGRLRDIVTEFVVHGRSDWAPFDRADGDVLRVGDGVRVEPGAFADMLRRWEGVDRP